MTRTGPALLTALLLPSLVLAAESTGTRVETAAASPRPPDLVVVAALSDRLWAEGIRKDLSARGVRVLVLEDAAVWARLDGCVDRDCWRRDMDRHHAQAIVLVSVREDGDDYVAQSRWYSTGRYVPERWDHRAPTEAGDAPVFDALYDHWLQLLHGDAD